MENKFNSVIAKVVGTTFRPLPEGKKIKVYGHPFKVDEFPSILTRGLLIPEPDNKYDEDAVKVIIELTDGTPHHIGYIGKDDPLKLQIKEPTSSLVRVVDYSELGNNISYQIIKHD